MKANMGKADRILRLISAIVITVLFLTHAISGIPGYILLAVAGIFIFTSAISFCPLYVPFGVSTCPKK